LARFVIGLPTTAANTEVAQWLERTLDDSAIRRITIPQAFLALDGVLNLHLNIASGLVVNHNIVAKRLAAEMPFMATETLLMECVQAGGDRQQCHELIRQKSMEAVAIIKAGGENPLIDLLKKEKALGIVKDKWDKILDPQQYKGRAQEQTIDFVQTIVEPLLQKHKAHIVTQSEVSV
ncbi:MAG: adenylosuccinate lyase, partial [Firmicutes bacterium]|nr:adenylosuccinate lyase [Bacillota bacterium]